MPQCNASATAVAIVATCLAACSSTSKPTAIAEDLSTWMQVGDKVWDIDETAVSAGPSEHSGYLVSRAEYEDFRLTVEFWIEDGVNSGVFVRCSDTSVFTSISPVTCYEINIWDDHPNQKFRTGSVVALAPPGIQVDTTGRWNAYELVVSGQSINVVLNGVETVALEDDKLASGTIALQYMGGGKVAFRNLRIQRL